MFKLNNQLPVIRPFIKTLPVASGITISEGDVVKVANDRFDLCATNQVVFGVSKTKGSVVGNAGGTTEVEVILAHNGIFEVAQGALSDANTQVGDTVDINATSDGVTTDSNHDFKIYEVDRDKNLLYGMFCRASEFIF